MRTSFGAPTAEVVSRRTPLPRLVLLALPILGFTAGLPEYLDFGGITLHLIVAIGLASLGWLRGAPRAALRKYLVWAGMLAVWFGVSAIAAWDSGTVSRSVIAAVWLIVVAPGIANLLRDAPHRRSLMWGMIAAGVFYSVTALGRKLTGREMFDMPNPSQALLLGEKRGFVNARLLYVLPFLVAHVPPALRRTRRIVLCAFIATVVLSGGRAGLLGLGVVAGVFVLLEPGTNRKVRGIVAAALLGLVLVMTVSEFGGQAVVSQNRLLAFIRGERTNSDEIRELQLKRAWAVGWEHPAFGIGYNNLAGLDHPALDDAKNSSLRGRAQSFGVHNTYAQVFGELGLPGVIAFLGLIGSILAAGIRRSRDPEVRAAMAGFSGLLFTMLLNPMSLPFVYLTLAYVVGLLDDESRQPHGAEPDRSAAVEV